MQSAFIKRAQHARECVTRLVDEKNLAAEYVRAVRGLPAEIRLVGLGQGLAVLLSRSDGKMDGYRRLHDDIENWMFSGNPNKVYTITDGERRLLRAIITGDQQKYRLAVAEVDAYLAVLKRLAEVFLTPEEPPGEGARPQAVTGP